MPKGIYKRTEENIRNLSISHMLDPHTTHRKCCMCQKTKLIDDFVKARNSPLGIGYRCKSCHSENFTGEKGRIWRKKYQQKNPYKNQARNKINNFIKLGKIIPKNCEVCGEIKVEAHHYKGYEKENWLEVQWLCFKHHREADYKITYKK